MYCQFYVGKSPASPAVSNQDSQSKVPVPNDMQSESKVPVSDDMQNGPSLGMKLYFYLVYYDTNKTEKCGTAKRSMCKMLTEQIVDFYAKHFGAHSHMPLKQSFSYRFKMV